MARRKVLSGTQMNPRNLVGKQTAARQLYQQFGMRGGLDNNGDISIQAPSEWLNATNARMPSLTNSAFGGVIGTPQPQTMFNLDYYTVNNGIFYSAPPPFLNLAALQNSSFPTETVVFSGTGTGTDNRTATSYLGAGYCLLECGNSKTESMAVTINALDIYSWVNTLPMIAIDIQDVLSGGPSTFSTGSLKIGSDATNYFEWSILGSQFGTGNQYYLPVKFLWSEGTVTGTPNLASITYIDISFSTGASNSFKYTIGNIRLTNFNSVISTTTTYPKLETNITKAYPYVTQNGNPYINTLMLIANGTLFSDLPVHSTEGLGTSYDYTNTLQAIASGFTLGARYNFSNYESAENENDLYFVNGADGIFKYIYQTDPLYTQSFTQISTTAYKYLAYFNGYMWYAGDPANPNQLMPSLLGDPDTLDTSNVIDIGNNSGQSIITGLVSMDTYLIIFRTNDIFILTGNLTGTGGNIAIQSSLSTVGAISQDTICRVGPYAYFWNGNGIYIFNGSYETLISNKINFSINGVQIDPNSMVLEYNPNEQCVYAFCGSLDQHLTANNPIPSTSYSNFGAFIYNPAEKVWAFIGGTDDPLSVFFGGFSFISPNDNKTYWYTYGMEMMSQVSASGLTWPVSYRQDFMVQSCWNNLNSPFMYKDPDQVRLFLTASQSNVSGILNFYADFVDTPIYSTLFSVPQTGSSPFVDLTVGAGAQGCAFSVEVIVPNNDVAFIVDNEGNNVETNEDDLVCDNGDGTYNQVVYSGYGLSYTESEVI